ncbi:MAG TPA: hypothetical protein VF637_07985 [Sphingomicrobium sp.]|jgi:hypothetical protein
MTDWVRLWHDMPTDPKWRVIARKSGQPLPCVISVFTLMLTNASGNAAARGVLLGWDHEDAGAALDMDADDVRAIYDAMQGKVLEGERLTGWERRQPKREDAGVAGRVAKYRETKANAAKRDVTHGNAPETETETETPDKSGVAPQRANRLPPDFVVPTEWLRWARAEKPWNDADVTEEAAAFVDHWHAKPGKDGTKLDWFATWRNWCRNSRRKPGQTAGNVQRLTI